MVFEGHLIGKGLKIGIVLGRFNDFITSRLYEGALDCLLRHGVSEEDVDKLWVPGAFEIPLAAKKLVQLKKYDAVICLGAVIRGSTPHFEYVSSEVTKGIAQVGLDFACPVVMGVLTTDSIEQCIERAGTKSGNKGCEAALTAIEMANLLQMLEKSIVY